MRIDRSVLGWGVFLLLAGAVPLAVREGYVPPEAIAQWWRLWPLVLIGLGIGIILGRTALGWLGGLVIAATFGLLVGSALATGVGRGVCLPELADRGAGARTTVGGELAEGGSVELVFACGQLDVGVTSGGGWALTYLRDAGAEPDVVQAPDRLFLATPEGSFPGPGSEWELLLPSDRSISLNVAAGQGSTELRLSGARLSRLDGTFNAGSLSLDLSGASLDALDLRLNAGSGSVTLPAATFGGRIQVNAGSLEVCAPSGTGLRIATSGALSSTDFAGSGLVLSGTTWESPDYATASTRIDLTVTANAASVTLRRDGGCP